MAPAGLDYLEEPCASAAEIPQFHRATGIPVALDETLDDHLREGGGAGDLLPSIAASEGVVALVVKPSVVGGIEACGALASRAREDGLRVILSSAFESSAGLAAIAALAAAADGAGKAGGARPGNG